MKGTYSQEQPRGPNGERLCYWCKNTVKPPKRSFCSESCVHEWKLRTRPSYVRTCLKKRDKEICALCGLDCKRLKIRLSQLWLENRELWQIEIEKYPMPKHFRRYLWDADHIVPVCEGGGECGLDNFRTLCIWCHKKETAKLRTQRSQNKNTIPLTSNN
jgi:5-methylcytosine-specific restriction protein A